MLSRNDMLAVGAGPTSARRPEGQRAAALWIVGAAALGCVAAGVPSVVSAQAYPGKPVRMIVASSAGSNPDTAARVVAAALGRALGQQVVVDNRAGAGGNIGAAVAARAPADGYTLFVAHVNHSINAALYRKLPYDLRRDFVPVSIIALAPYVASIHPSVPARTLPELIRIAKARPKDLVYSSAGIGSGSFFAAEYLKALADVDMLHVPYTGGGPAVAAVIAGETSICFMPVSVGLPHYRAGKLMPIAVSSAERIKQLPGVATMAETIAGYEMVGWIGLFAPAQIPAPVADIVSRAVTSVLTETSAGRRLSDLGYVVKSTRPEETAAYVSGEIEKYAHLIRRLELPRQ